MSSNKKKKLTQSETSTKKLKPADQSEDDGNSFIEDIVEERKNAASSVKQFKFNKKRVKILSEAQDIPIRAQSVLYWMSRDQRVQGIFNYVKFYNVIIRNN